MRWASRAIIAFLSALGPIYGQTATVQAEHGGRDLLAFAKKTAGKYVDEVPRDLFKLTFLARVQAKPIDGFFRAKYDGATKVIYVVLWRDHDRVGTTRVFEQCRDLGRYVGTNALGVSVAVQKKDCESVYLRGPAQAVPFGLPYWDGFGLKFKGRPDDLRRLEANEGFDVEIEFRAIPPTDDDFVTIKEPRRRSSPSISYPVDASYQEYVVFAEITRLRYYLPGERRPFAEGAPSVVSDEPVPDPK